MWFNEEDKWTMRQNPIGPSRIQRPMPTWFSASLVNQSSVLIGQSQENVQPPAPIQPLQLDDVDGEEESEYEEIDHIHNYSNMNSNSDSHLRSENGSCALCGNPNPLVRCEMCNNQIFCGACNEMFHRHPKRHNHTRKILEFTENLPPLPPKIHSQTFVTPVPPPRRNRRMGFRSTNNSPTMVKKFSFDPMGSLKRFVTGKSRQRPLPMPPNNREQMGVSGQGRFPSSSFCRSPGNNRQPCNQLQGHLMNDRRQSAPFPSSSLHSSQITQRSGSFTSGSPGLNPSLNYRHENEVHGSIPLTVMEIGNSRQQRIPSKPPSRDSGWDEDEDEFVPRNQRAFSVSACNLQRFPTSTSDASHFATLQRKGSTPPSRPPPPVPPRDFSRQMQPSASVFELNRAGAFIPWQNQFNQNPFPPYHQSMQRTPSAGFQESQSPFNWNQRHFETQGQQMSSSEMNLDRRSSEPQQPSYGNQGFSEKQQKVNKRSNDGSRSQIQMMQLPPTPKRKNMPLPPKHEPEYYSGEESDTGAQVNIPELNRLSDNPEGPWSCEHCTFVNAKSTKVCIVCCKTPVEGYRMIPTEKERNSGKTRRDKYIEEELVPVVKSKLSFSNSKAQPSQKINLSIEKVRKSSSNVRPQRDSYDSETESESSESSSSEDLITEKHKSLVRENKPNTLNKRVSEVEKDYQMDSRTSSRARSVSVSRGVEHTPKNVKSKQTNMVDTGTGEYSILDAEVMAQNRRKLEEKSKIVPVEIEHKNSIGTSPPPQEISTQTYEELPQPKLQRKSISASVQSSIQSYESSPPRAVEMSDKALRYARRAQQQSQLKRSMSAHLTSVQSSSSDPWNGNSQRPHHHEGRQLYRSSSRHSLASDTRSLPISGPPSRDISPPPSRSRYYEDSRRFAQPSWDRFPSPADYFASIEDLVTKKRRDSMKSQEFELSRLLKEAEELNYTPEDLQVALRMCGTDRNPVKWLEENWGNMVETVQTLATKYGRDKGQEFNEIGTISSPEAKDALRLHKGNVWAAVTECVEQRRKKFIELHSRGSFLREDILTSLTANQGNIDAAYVELSKAQLKPFLMRIWGPPTGKDNESAPPPPPPPPPIPHNPVSKDLTVNLHEQGSSSIDKNLPEPALNINNSEIDASNFAQIDATQDNLSNTKKLINDEHLPLLEADPSTKTDADEETFYDPEPILVETKITDPELDTEESEANVSEFIQNFEIPPPSPIPSFNHVVSVNSGESEKKIKESKDQMTGKNECGNMTLENPNPTSDTLNVSLEKESILTKEPTVTSPQDIESLSLAMGVIAEKLNELIRHQQNLPSNSENTSIVIEKNENDEHGNKIEKVENVLENGIRNTISPEQTNSVPKAMKEKQEVETLKDIYREEFKVLKDLVLENNEERLFTKNFIGENKDNPSLVVVTPGSINEKEKEAYAGSGIRIASNRIYEALGNFAGSFLGRSTSKNRDMKPSSEEDLYETVAVTTNNAAETECKNKILADMLEEKMRGLNLQDSKLLLENMDDFDQSDSRPTALTQISRKKNQIHMQDSLQNERIGTDIDSDNYSGSDENEVVSIESDRDHGEYISDENEDLNSQSESDALEEDVESEDALAYGESSTEVGVGEDIITMNENAKILGTFNTELDENNIIADDSKSDKQNRKRRDVRRLLKSGKVDSVEKAQIAFNLMDMDFTEEDSLQAANECSSLYTAISFLQQECLLCAGKFSAKEMVSMLRCKHSCCRTCASEYFMVQIRDHTIIDATCPFCKEPSNLSEEGDQASEYFSHLEILLKDLLNENFYDMFGRKLRDWTLAKTPNFKWCSKCSSGFITEPLQTHLVCPDCSAVTCAICLEPWDKINHEHRDRVSGSQVFCDETSEAFPKSILETLNENSVECPRCHLKFSLARGGCMHLTCSQCRFEFCSGCSAPFAMGLKCKQNTSFCAKLGLHAHHPRNCLFYLRDKVPQLLKKLLQESNVKFFGSNDSTPNNNVTGNENLLKKRKCKVSLQRETTDGLQDDNCGQEVCKESSDVCLTHYVEYLGLLVWENRLDPIPILTNDDLETIVKRAHKKMPPRSYGTTEAEYRPLLLKVIVDEIPLEL